MPEIRVIKKGENEITSETFENGEIWSKEKLQTIEKIFIPEEGLPQFGEGGGVGPTLIPMPNSDGGKAKPEPGKTDAPDLPPLPEEVPDPGPYQEAEIRVSFAGESRILTFSDGVELGLEGYDSLDKDDRPLLIPEGGRGVPGMIQYIKRGSDEVITLQIDKDITWDMDTVRNIESIRRSDARTFEMRLGDDLVFGFEDYTLTLKGFFKLKPEDRPKIYDLEWFIPLPPIEDVTRVIKEEGEVDGDGEFSTADTDFEYTDINISGLSLLDSSVENPIFFDGEAIGGFASGLSGLLGGGTGELTDDLGGTLDDIGDSVGDLVDNLGDTVGDVLDDLGDTIGDTLGGVGDALDGIGDTIGDLVNPILTIPSTPPVTVSIAGTTVSLSAINNTGSPVRVFFSVAGIGILPTFIDIPNGSQSAGIDISLVPPLSNFTITLTGTNNSAVTVNAGQSSSTVNTPVIIDLDGDGLEFSGSLVGFDIDDDGILEPTVWASGDDGFLVYDENANGLVDQRQELVFSEHAPDAETDLEAIKTAFDSNNDAELTPEDDEWGSFAIWQDANEDGITDEGELKTLDELGVASIGLVNDGNASNLIPGAHLHGQSLITYEDGSTGLVGDLSLRSFDNEIPEILSDQGQVDFTDSATENSSGSEEDGELLTEIAQEATGGAATEAIAEPATADPSAIPEDAFAAGGAETNTDTPPAVVV